MKIGWFTPFNPHSAVGNYSEAVCAALTAGADEVTVFASEPDGQGEPRPAPFPVVRLAPHVTPACLEQFDRFDLLVYNMGNHMPYHRKVYDLALCRPVRDDELRLSLDFLSRQPLEAFCLVLLNTNEFAYVD